MPRTHKLDYSATIQASANDTETIANMLRRRRTLLTVSEVADLIQWSTKHLYKLCADGRMPHASYGGSLRFDPATTANWMESKNVL